MTEYPKGDAGSAAWALFLGKLAHSNWDDYLFLTTDSEQVSVDINVFFYLSLEASTDKGPPVAAAL